MLTVIVSCALSETKRKKWIVKMKKYIFLIIVVCVVAIALYASQQTGLRIGIANDKFPVLNGGMYQQGATLELEPGTYAVYAKSGKGEVRIEDKTYYLDDALFIEAKKQPSNTQNAVIYEESPKIVIAERSELEVIGEQNFSISFIRR